MFATKAVFLQGRMVVILKRRALYNSRTFSHSLSWLSACSSAKDLWIRWPEYARIFISVLVRSGFDRACGRAEVQRAKCYMQSWGPASTSQGVLRAISLVHRPYAYILATKVLDEYSFTSATVVWLVF